MCYIWIFGIITFKRLYFVVCKSLNKAKNISKSPWGSIEDIGWWAAARPLEEERLEAQRKRLLLVTFDAQNVASVGSSLFRDTGNKWVDSRILVRPVLYVFIDGIREDSERGISVLKHWRSSKLSHFEAFGVWETQRPLCVEGKRVFIRHPFNWLCLMLSAVRFLLANWSWFSKYIRVCFCEIFALRAHVQWLSWRSDVALSLQTITVTDTHQHKYSCFVKKPVFKDFFFL